MVSRLQVHFVLDVELVHEVGVKRDLNNDDDRGESSRCPYNSLIESCES